jgi:hypothetical protein
MENTWIMRGRSKSTTKGGLRRVSLLAGHIHVICPKMEFHPPESRPEAAYNFSFFSTCILVVCCVSSLTSLSEYLSSNPMGWGVVLMAAQSEFWKVDLPLS